MAYLIRRLLRGDNLTYLHCLKNSLRTLTHLSRKCVNKSPCIHNASHLLWKNPRLIVYSSDLRKYSTTNDEEYFADVDSMYYENVYNYDCDFVNVKCLYPDTNDAVIGRLQQCTSLQNVFDIVAEEKTLNHQQACQAIVTLHALQKIFYKQFVENLDTHQFESSMTNFVSQYSQEILTHPYFNNILSSISSHSHEFSIDENTHLLLFLKQIGYDLDKDVMRTLLNNCVEQMESHSEDWDIAAILKYANFIRSNNILHFTYLAAKSLAPLMKHLSECKSAEEWESITRCLIYARIVLSTTLLDFYKTKLRDLIEGGVLTPENIDGILVTINFLNLIHWSNRNFREIIYLCRFLKPSIHKMDAKNIINLHKIFQVHFEPATIIEPMQKRVAYLLDTLKNDRTLKTVLLMPDLLYFKSSLSSIKDKTILEKTLVDLIRTPCVNNFLVFYNSLRFLKMSDMEVCNLYWKKIAENLLVDGSNSRLMQTCYKYMYFNDYSGKLYHMQYFQDVLIGRLYDVLLNEESGHITSRFCRYLAFIIAYGLKDTTDRGNQQKNEYLINRLAEFTHQLSPLDCSILSRAIQIFHHSPMLKNNLFNLTMKVNSAVDSASIRHSKRGQIPLNDLNILCKSYINRNSAYDNDHFHTLLYKYNFIRDDELSCRSIKQICFNFVMTNSYVPSILEKIQDYVVACKDDVFGEIGQKVLNVFFQSGITPKNESFFVILSNILKRDINIINSLSLLQYCIHLAYYGHLSEGIVKQIFSLEFLERIDLEVSTCYSKRTYPKRLRMQLMALNRIVCLDYPQYDIPWFHQKYIEELQAYTPVRRSMFADDVYNNLLNITGRTDVIKSLHFSPYGYKVDFYLEFDKNRNLIGKVQNTDEIQKLGILLLHDRDFARIFASDDSMSDNAIPGMFSKRKNSTCKLQTRHLEQLGYRIAEIPYSFWNSMYMAEPGAKMNYLKNILYK